MNIHSILIPLLAAFAVPTGDDGPVTGWLSWRGPQQNGASLETGLFDTLEVDGQNHLWSYELAGRGTPVIADGRVYTIGYEGAGPDLQEVLVCLDEETGAPIWERRWSDFLSDVIYGRYSIGSPTVDPETGNVYVLTTAGQLRAYTRDGEPIWEHSLMSEFGRLTFPNGRTGAPAVDRHLVIVNVITAHWGRVEGPARTRLYAFEKRSGRHVWTSTPGGPPKDSSFAFPVFEWRHGRRVLYAAGGGGYVFGVDARTGDPQWRYRMATGGMNSSVVLFGDSLIAIHGKENVDSSAIGRMVSLPLGTEPEAGQAGPVELNKESENWRNELVAFTSSPVLVGDRVYQTVATGELCCVDAGSGEVLWHEKLAPDQIHASPVAADGKLYVPMNNGTFHVVRPTDEGPETLCRVQLEGNCLGAPAVCNGRVYVHTTAKLYCFGTGSGQFVAPAPVKDPVGGGRPVGLLVVPGDVLLRQGESVGVQVFALDARGRDITSTGLAARWKYSPGVGVQVDETSGRLVALRDAKPGVGMLEAFGTDLSGTTRVRVVPRLPYLEDFEELVPDKPDPAQEGVKFAFPPSFWIGAMKKWDVRQVGESQVLAKTLDNPLFQRSTAFFGHPEMSDYTVQVDIMTDGNRRSMSTAGVVNQRYLVQLKGNHQELEVSSNVERLKESVPFSWKAGIWYTLKTRVDVSEDGSGIVRAKAWPRDEAEPEGWNLEVGHRHAHTQGSPGVFSFSPQSRFRVYLDNLSVIPND